MADCWDVGVPVESTSWDVFVSYARADHQAVDGLVEALRALGITVWRDVARIDSFDGITARLEEGIAGARLVVMCLSHTYPSRPACQWEALQVLRRLPPGQVTARLCPVAVTAGAGLASWPILSDLQVPEAVGTAVGDGDPWSHAAGAVRARLDALGPIAGGVRTPIGPAPDQPVVWLPGLPRQSATFTGMFTEMLELHSLLTSDRAGLDSGRTGVRLPVAVVGMGGVGKTLLVQEYVRHFSGSWPVVVRVNAAGDRFGHRIAGDEVRAVWLGMPHDQPYRRPRRGCSTQRVVAVVRSQAGHALGMSGIGPDGRTLQLVRGAGSLQFRDPITRAPLGPPVQWHPNWESARSFALGADGRVLLASGADDCSVSVWDATTGVPVVPPLHGHTRTVNAVAFGVGPDGQLLLASGSSDGTVRLWDPLAGALLGDPMVGHVDRVLTVALGGGPEGSVMLASGSDDGTVRIWAPQAGRALDSPVDHDDWVTSVALGVGPLGRALVASGSADRTVRVWDPATGRALGGPLVGHANWVTSVAFGVAADGRLLLASGSSDGTVRVWDPVAGVSVGAPLTGHRSGVTSVAFGVAADGRLLLASGSLSGPPCLVHDPETGRAISSCAALHVVAAVAFGSGTGGRALLATGYGAQIAMVDPLDGKAVWLSTVGHGWTSDGLTSLALGELPDGRALLVTGGRDSSARVFDPVSGRLLGEPLTGFPGPVACVAIGLDGAGRLLIVTAAGNGWTTFELLGW